MKTKCQRPKAENVPPAALLSLVVCVLAASPAFAQQTRPAWQPRVFVSVNAVERTTSRTLSDSVTFSTPFSAGREPATAASTYEIPAGVMFDGEGIVRLWRGLGAGVAVSGFSSRSDFNITAQLPHPFFFNQMRTIEGTVNSRHAETTVNLLAAYYIPLAPRFSVIVSAGPSWFSVEQKLVRSVTGIELYPFDTAQFGTADLDVFNTTAWGFNAGADVSWMFTRNLGVGGVLRFTQATVEMTPTGRSSVKLDVGGFHVGGGARITF